MAAPSVARKKVKFSNCRLRKKHKNVSFYGVCMYVRPKLTFVSFFMFFCTLPQAIWFGWIRLFWREVGVSYRVILISTAHSGALVVSWYRRIWWRFRSTLQMSCNASPQIWRFTWCRKSNFNLIFGILRCSAFWICVTLWGQKWTVWPWESIFFKKCFKNSYFDGHDSGSPDFGEG